jgi:hypothetical protein
MPLYAVSSCSKLFCDPGSLAAADPHLVHVEKAKYVPFTSCFFISSRSSEMAFDYLNLPIIENNIFDISSKS